MPGPRPADGLLPQGGTPRGGHAMAIHMHHSMDVMGLKEGVTTLFGASPPVVGTLRVVGAFTGLGAQRPGAPAWQGPCFLYKKAGERIAGVPPAPLFQGRSLLARSIFWVGGLWNGLFLARVHQTRFGNAYSEKTIFCWILLCKKSSQENLSKESPQIRARTWAASKPTAVSLRRYPKRWSEPQRAVVLFLGVQGVPPADSCVRAFS